MKNKFVLLASLLVSTSLAQAQTQSAPGGGQAAGQSGQSGAAVGAQQPGVPTPGNPAQRGVPTPPQPGVPSQPGVGGNESTIFNQPAGANQPQPRFGGTNQVPFGGTNRVLPGTNQAFGGTNVPPGGAFNDPAGATAATNQFGRAGAGTTNQPGQAGNLADQAFTQQMRAVLARPGATRIFFPQTRSTISVQNQNGALTLQGFVTSEEEKRSIEARIQNTPGVTSIDNQLQVGATQGIAPRTPGINPAPNSQIPEQERRLLNP